MSAVRWGQDKTWEDSLAAFRYCKSEEAIVPAWISWSKIYSTYCQVPNLTSPDIHGGTAAAHTVQSIALQAGIEALEPVLVAELGVVTAL